MIYNNIYKIGVRYRNPSLWQYYIFLKNSETWNSGQLQQFQFDRCKDFLKFVYKYSDYYKLVFDAVGFVPSMMQSLDDMKVIPIIDKSVLLDKNKEIHTKYKFKKVRLSETSGTSGQVLKFYRNEEWDSANRAAMFRGYSWYDVYPWDRNGYFWGYNIDKKAQCRTKILDVLQNRFRVFSYDEEHIRIFANKLKKAKYLNGYSSMIYETAKLINQLGISDIYNLKMIKGTSEKIYDNYDDEVKKAFGHKIISEYGSAESGLIAFECPECGNMHINIENVIVEEENGEIVVTNLLSRSFPIIRYKLGDSILLADENFNCPCGRNHPILLDVQGRIGKSIYGKTKKYPSLTFYYVFKNLALNKKIALNYQAKQREKGKIILNIEQDSPECIYDLQAEIDKYFGKDVDFEINWGKTIHAHNGKLRDFITELE